jgi:hypothetical protein
MLNLPLDGAERFEKGNPNAYWEGWDLVLFKPRPGADLSVNGVFHNGRWGLATRVSPDEKTGKYRFRV